jgi:hypothetical protein
MSDLEQVIEDSVNDATAPDSTPDTSVEETPSIETESAERPEGAETPEAESTQAPTPGSLQEEAVEDEFAKKFGLAANSITGRENRIPYSRVKKIVAKAEQDALAKYKKENEATSQPKFAELETKVKDYEDRLTRVAQFEHIIENDPKTFLNMLAGIPAYKEFFAYIEQLAARPEQPPSSAAQPDADMPQPGPDGLYDMAGLQKLLDWQAKKVEDRVTKQITQQVEQRYDPIRQQWESEQRRQQMIPVIQKQIADARTWPGFAENETEIIEVLKADQNISLEAAYRKVYIPKLQAQAQTTRDDMRRTVLEELKGRPTTTSVPTSAVKPNPTKPQGPRNLEDVIADAVKTLK